jgi:hypothetical protein
MRPSKLISALAAASALLVLAPAAVAAPRAAKKHAHPNGRCRLSLVVEPRTITAGESVQLFGQLLCTGAGTENQPVAVYQRTAGSSVFKVIGAPTTAAGGAYTLVVPGVSSDSVFYTRALNVRSGHKAVKVAPVVKLEGPPENVPLLTGVNNHVTFTGTVSPADVGAEVLLERENTTSTEEWKAIQRGVVGPGGAYTFLHTFVAPGAASLRTVVRPHGLFTVRGLSNTLNYVISQRQNLNLTIESSADPTSYGTPITIKGVLKGGEGKTITLLSHKKTIKPFQAVMTTTAGQGGKYEFATVMLKNTAFRVTGNGVTSAIVYEAVKYILTAGVSAKAIQAGQALIFSGTVTPVHPGKIVYLERENTFGGGYHVVGIGTVVPAGPEKGTYSIPHFVFGVGKQVFRIKVPGDSENQSIAGAPFTVEVAPASPGTLRPHAQDRQPG